ncbi:hypothetical protein PDE_09696 [Penicillium oxalicum 114-2]|uniref:Uncharacterized protein n=1 Tax=Penicillium oxalicum (strain 114-2 / CGMCC 5302) TaxID=933388 RepID=S8BHN7_PENO1|nr:hypothetical protein PDE_09696 [Penicillium oxalicum 114-2]
MSTGRLLRFSEQLDRWLVSHLNQGLTSSETTHSLDVPVFPSTLMLSLSCLRRPGRRNETCSSSSASPENGVQAPACQGRLSAAFWPLCRIGLSISFLLLDSVVLVLAILFSHLRAAFARNRATPRKVPLDTVLISGIGTTAGLALARKWHARGYRVVGVDIVECHLPLRPGGGMSNTLATFYRVSKDRYVSQMLDLVLREHVAIWIPCAPQCSPIEDAALRQIVESRTVCKCITLDPGMTATFIDTQSFREHLAGKGLPVPQQHRVHSRDSIHKILNRSAGKSYMMHEVGPRMKGPGVMLPKRTLSSTYTTVSELTVSEDTPWVMNQRVRLGVFWADLLVIRGHIQAFHVRTEEASWTCRESASRLDQALVTSVHRLMQRVTVQDGQRMTGHLSVRLLVDEEFEPASVRHAIYISDCVLGARAVDYLFRHTDLPIAGYLAALNRELAFDPSKPPLLLALSSPAKPLSWDFYARCSFGLLTHDQLECLQHEISPFLLWKSLHFSLGDPLPWWWHLHVYQPICELRVLARQFRRHFESRFLSSRPAAAE